MTAITAVIATRHLETSDRPVSTKKADVAEHPRVFDHVGFLIDKPPGRPGFLFI
jgi:hypothetical protein